MLQKTSKEKLSYLTFYAFAAFKAKKPGITFQNFMLNKKQL